VALGQIEEPSRPGKTSPPARAWRRTARWSAASSASASRASGRPAGLPHARLHQPV